MFPRKRVEVFIDKPYDVLLETLKKEILGKQTYKLETLLGQRDLVYFGEYNFDHYLIERKQSILLGIMIIPSAEVHIKKIDESKCVVEMIIKLSTIWKFFISILYAIIFSLILYQVISMGFSQAGIILIKSITGIIIINLFIILTHYYEVNLYMQLLKYLDKKSN